MRTKPQLDIPHGLDSYQNLLVEGAIVKVERLSTLQEQPTDAVTVRETSNKVSGLAKEFSGSSHLGMVRLFGSVGSVAAGGK